MKYYNIGNMMGKPRAGAYIGFGPKASKGLIVKGLSDSPSPLNYKIPST
jgi:hypothetical protein